MKQLNLLIIFASCALIITTILIYPANSASLIQKRAILADDSNEIEKESTLPPCHHSTPCGWAVYTPFKRRVNSFVRNLCTCPGNKKCLYSMDDLSVSAYVYRCRDPPKNNTLTRDQS